jgi:hypothetical protein
MDLRVEALLAVLVFALCLPAAVAPVQVANMLFRRRIAEEGDPAFTLFYRVVAITGAVACSYILVTDLWQIAQS